MPEALIRNGWFVNSDHVVFAVINGSCYETDASNTPLKDLPPGSYTDEEVTAAIEKLDAKK